MKKVETDYPSKDKTHLKGVSFFENHPIIPNFLSVSNAINLLTLKDEKYVIDCLDLRVKSSELKKDSLILAKALLELGIRPGDIVACGMPNYYQAFLVFMAANTIGAITTFLNPHATTSELIEYLNLYESKVFINMDTTQEIKDRIIQNTKVKSIISLKKENINNRNFYHNSLNITGNKNHINFNEIGNIAKYQKDNFKKWFGGSQDSLILHTSGSTGKPKSMLFTNENVLAALIYLKNSTHTQKPTPEDSRWMNVVPFMYPYGFVASVLAPLLCGREVILTPQVNASTISAIYEKNPNIIFGSPAFLELTKRNLPQSQNCEGLHTFVSGGDFLSVQNSLDAINFFKEHNADVMMANGSGNGEILGCCTNSMNIDYKPETVGQLVVGPEYIIIDPVTKKEVKYGKAGVLCVAGKHVFKEYYKDENATNETMIRINNKLYYNTGNYGILHKDRYFELIGRASRFYIPASLNKVYCELVQRFISKIECVEACVIVPKPDKDELFVGKAYIKLKQGFEPTEETKDFIMNMCYMPLKDELGQDIILKEYEIPTSITFVEEIQRHHDSDKIDYEYYKKIAEVEFEEESLSIGENKKLLK